jgi:modulator of FtsH protease HflC
MKNNIVTIITAVVIGVILILYLVSFQVRVNESAVVSTFGKPVRILDEPGLYWKWPWPAQTVHVFDSRLSVLDSPFEETYTKDGKNLLIATSLAWRINDPLKFLEIVGTKAEGERNIRSILRNYQNAVIGMHPLNYLISTDPEELKFNEIEGIIMEMVSEETESHYGISVEFVKITRIGLPEDTTEKVFSRMRAERSRLAESYRAQGEGEANKIRAEAESERDRIIAKAEAEAKRIRGEGDALAARYYSVFSENEELAIFLRKLDALEETLKEKTTAVLHTNMAPYDLLEKSPDVKAEGGGDGE